MGVAHHLARVTTGYWIKNLHLSYAVTIKTTHEFEWYKVFVEIDWKNFEKDLMFLLLFLKYGRKIPAE